MKYRRFEDLPVWKDAAQLGATMFSWTSQSEFRGRGDLASQMQRATLSISNNIAEGFERGTTNELIRFLYYARGSAGEVRSMLCVLELMPEVRHFKSEISSLKSTCESISRQIRGWTNSLQNSDIKGQRHLNDSSRRAYQQQQKRSAFQERLDRIQQDHKAKQNQDQDTSSR